MSRNTVLVLMLCLGLFGAWRHFHGSDETADPAIATAPSVSPDGNVLVYGRDGCSYTRTTLAALHSQNVPVTYINIDYLDAYNAFHEKFDGTDLAGARGYALPVVEVAGRASMRPGLNTVLRQFRETQ